MPTDRASQDHEAAVVLSPLYSEETEAEHPVVRGGPGIRTSVCVTPELLGTSLGCLRIFEGCFKHPVQVPFHFLPFLCQWSPGVPSSPLPQCSGERPRAVCAA